MKPDHWVPLLLFVLVVAFLTFARIAWQDAHKPQAVQQKAAAAPKVNQAAQRLVCSGRVDVGRVDLILCRDTRTGMEFIVGEGVQSVALMEVRKR